jgi:hypothetical protein
MDPVSIATCPERWTGVRFLDMELPQFQLQPVQTKEQIQAESLAVEMHLYDPMSW